MAEFVLGLVTQNCFYSIKLSPAITSILKSDGEIYSIDVSILYRVSQKDGIASIWKIFWKHFRLVFNSNCLVSLSVLRMLEVYYVLGCCKAEKLIN